MTALWLAVGIVVIRRPKKALRELRETDVRSALLAGVGVAIAYALVLAAYRFARNVAYVVAFRQVSLPIGTLLGAIALHERVGIPRLVGTIVLVAGLALVAVG